MTSEQASNENSLAKNIADGMKAATTFTTFFSFPLALFAYFYVGSEVAEDIGCSDFLEALFNLSSCSSLKEIAVINAAAAFAEGDIITNISIAGSVIGLLVGLFRHYANKRWVERHRMRPILPIDFSENLELQTISSEAERALFQEMEWQPVQYVDYIDRLNTISWNAWLSSRFALLSGGLIGLPVMFRVGNEILTEFGCQSTMWDLFLFSSREEACPVQYLYWAMTAFAYPWAYGTWMGYLAWEFSVLLQVLPQQVRDCLSTPFNKIFSLLSCVNFMSPQNKKDLLSFIQLTVKIFGLGALCCLLFPALLDGVKFSNRVFESSGCHEISLLSTVFSSSFDLSSPGCFWLMQLLGMDAFPTVTEIYDLLPLALLTVGAGALIGSVVGGVVLAKSGDRVRLREKLAELRQSVESVYATGHKASLLFIPISGYGILCCAIPKARQVLKMSPGCEELGFPAFMWEFAWTECAPRSAASANAAYISTMWIIFSYSLMTFYGAGVIGHVGYKGAQQVRMCCSRFSQSRLFSSAPQAAGYIQVADEEENLESDSDSESDAGSGFDYGS